MNGEFRRNALITELEGANKPLSGTALAKKFGVSRQIIVQDIALLRATNKNILSTNKGYVLYQPKDSYPCARRTFSVMHSDDEMQKELYTIVDFGGKVLDVVVEHDVYGVITVDLILRTRSDVDEFMEKLKNSQSKPLNVLTCGRHYHTVEAASEEVLDVIGQQLSKLGFLK